MRPQVYTEDGLGTNMDEVKQLIFDFILEN